MAATSVIRIDPDDELPAILERLPSAGVCVLVLPPHSRALNSVVGAKLLSRRAEALGTRVAVVTGDHAVMAHARSAGVPVAETVDEARHLLNGDDAPTSVFDVPLDDDDAPPIASTDPFTEPKAAGDATPAPSAIFTSGLRQPRHAGSAAASAPGPDDTAGIRGHSGAQRSAGGRRAAAGAAGGPPPKRPGSSRLPGSQGGGPGRYLVTAALVIVPLLVLGWLASYVLGGLLNPSATLTLRPRAAIVTGATTLRAVLNLPQRKHTMYLVGMGRTTQYEQSKVALPMNGKTILPGRIASGVVDLANLTAKTLLVPAGTTFTTKLNTVSFVTTRDVSLPAAELGFAVAKYGVASNVPVSATLGGTSGNVPPGAIINSPAAFSGAIQVRNRLSTRGGTDRTEPAVTPHDLTATANSLFGALEQQARRQIAQRFGGNVDQTALSVDKSPIVPVIAPNHRSATLTLSIVLHIAYTHRSDLIAAARTALEQNMALHPDATFIANSLDWTSTWTAVRPISAAVTWSPQTAITQSIALAVTGRTRPPMDMLALKRAISGRSKSEALAYLRGRSDVAYANIIFSPSWADRLPGDVQRIQVNVQEPQ